MKQKNKESSDVMKIAAYCRVSTEKEAQIDSLEKQIEFFNEFTKKNGYELYKLYADEGISGKQIKHRKQFQQMMIDAKAKKFDKVVVKDVSRFARNTVDLLQSVRELKSYGVQVDFLNNGEVMEGGSEFILTILGAMAQQESANMSKRVKFGKDITAKKGRVPNLVFGYDKIPDEKYILKINEEEAKIVKEIFESYVYKGIGTTKIAWNLNDRGIRTRFSDDLLWLPYAVIKYINFTGDYEILNKKTTYLQGEELKENENEKYNKYISSNIEESIYEHCKKAIKRACNFGENGLPKIGIGDWNDGFSNIGTEGKGESVWLGFFLYIILKEFSKLIKQCKQEEIETSNWYENIAEKLKENLNENAWDGKWYKRAFADNGDIYGSMENEECKIDSIAQSWSVISGAGDIEKKESAMKSLENHLVDNENGLIKLLDPAFDKSKLEPGYIKSYIPGVRENGGQYTHAAVWSIIAEAILGDGNKAVEWYKMINPIEHSRTKKEANRYKVEPYVMPADIYGNQNLLGQGGWTWYTGSSGWYYTAGIEYILGLKIYHNVLSINPCIQKEWDGYSIQFKYKESIYNINVKNISKVCTGVKMVELNGIEIENKILLDGSGKIFNVEVKM